MSFWFLPPQTSPDEHVLFEAAANTFRGQRSIGGKVTVTDRRLLFTPNRLDALTGAHRLAVDRTNIGRVWVEAPGREAVRQRGLGAAVHPQVGIDHPAGPSFITVGAPDALLGALLAASR